MGERVEKLVGARAGRHPLVSTFHSFCVRVLRRDIEHADCQLVLADETPGPQTYGDGFAPFVQEWAEGTSVTFYGDLLERVVVIYGASKAYAS